MPFLGTTTLGQLYLHRLKLDRRLREMDRVNRLVSYGLMNLGAQAGDRIGILAANRAEQVSTEIAVLGANAISVRIAPDAPESDWLQIIKQIQCPFLFIEGPQAYRRLQPHRQSLSFFKKIIAYDPSTLATAAKDPDLVSYQALSEIGRRAELKAPKKFEKHLLAWNPDDVFLIHNTPGVGADIIAIPITHSQIMSTFLDFSKFVRPNRERIFIRGPLSGPTLRLESLGGIAFGWDSVYPRNIYSAWTTEFKRAQPTLFFANSNDLFELKCSTQGSRLIGRRWNPLAKQFDKVKIRKSLGGRLRSIFCLSDTPEPRLADYFMKAGLNLLQGYGTTEAGPITLNTPRDRKNYSCGRPMKGVSIKLSNEGEILVHSPAHSRERPSDDWFKTGDFGTIDSKGYLLFTGRKKELLSTTAGLSIWPQKIESLLVSTPWIHRAVVSSDSSGQLVALLNLRREHVLSYANSQQILFSDFEGLIKNIKIQGWVQSVIESVNARLKPHETIRRFIILPHDFSAERGEVVANGKLRRKLISRNYRSITY